MFSVIAAGLSTNSSGGPAGAACPLAACHAIPGRHKSGISVLYASSDVLPEMVSLSRQPMGVLAMLLT